MNTVKNCAKSDMMNDALKHYDEAGRAINHWRSDIYEAIKAYYSEPNQLESSSPRPVEDGKPYWMIKNVFYSTIPHYLDVDGKRWVTDIHKATKFRNHTECTAEWILNNHCGYVTEHMDVSEGKSDMDIVAKFPEQKTIKAKLVYEQPEQEVNPEELWDLFSESVGESFDDVGFYAGRTVMAKDQFIKAIGKASLREVKMPDREAVKKRVNQGAYLNAVEKSNNVFQDVFELAVAWTIGEIKRINNLEQRF